MIISSLHDIKAFVYDCLHFVYTLFTDQKMFMERDVESFLRDELVKITAWAIKLFPTVISGIPDRLVIKNGRCWFVETKFKNGRISQKQKNVAKRLLKYGFSVYYIWNKEQVKEFIVKITNDL